MGVIQRPGGIVLFVTLDKEELDDSYQYRDHFISPTEFHWQSQNRTTQQSEFGQAIRNHEEQGIDIQLFVQRRKMIRGQTVPFIYCGTLDFLRWEGENPISVWWKMKVAVPEGVWGEVGVDR